jgi:hypothetical protein
MIAPIVTTATIPTPYSEILVDDIIAFGSLTTEWVVLDHPSTGNGTLMIQCIKTRIGGYGPQLGVIRDLCEGHTDVYLVEPREV